MRCLSLAFSGAAIRAWTVDRDCLLMGANATTSNVVVSDDSTLATTGLSAAPGTVANRWDVHLWLSSGGASCNFAPNFPLKIPLSKDRTIYVAVSGACWVFLYLEDSAEPIAT